MPNHYTADGPRVQSSSVPDRGPDSFNEWHEDMNFERDLERILEGGFQVPDSRKGTRGLLRE